MHRLLPLLGLTVVLLGCSSDKGFEAREVSRKDCGQRMSTSEKVHRLLVVVLCGFIPFASDVLFEGESAHRSAGWWVIFLSGLVVIAVSSIVLESLYRKRRARAETPDEAAQDTRPDRRRGPQRTG